MAYDIDEKTPNANLRIGIISLILLTMCTIGLPMVVALIVMLM